MPDWVNVALTCIIVIGGYSVITAFFHRATKSNLSSLKKNS